MTVKRILFLITSDLRIEQRVNKEIDTLARAGKRITIADMPKAVSADPTPGVEHVSVKLASRVLPKNLAFWAVKYLELCVRFITICVLKRPDAIHCLDRLALFPGGLGAMLTGARLVYDSQEIWPEVNSSLNRPRWLWLWLERFFARKCDTVIVTDEFRKKITMELLSLQTGCIALMNLPSVRAMVAAKGNIRQDSGFTGLKIIVYAGAIFPQRHMEDILLCLKHLPEEYGLTLVGFGPDEYIETLRHLARSNGLERRVAFLPPVRWNEVPDYLRGADCSVALYEKNSINNIYCSPSKVFDSFLAGVPVVGINSPLLLDLALKLDAVECIDNVSPQSIAAAAKKLIDRFSSAALRGELEEQARLHYTWEAQEAALLNVYF